MKRYILTLILLLPATLLWGQQRFLQFVYVSDCHYGVEHSKRVNCAMIKKINNLPSLAFPYDGGVRGGESVEWVDYVINTGDIANRAEQGVQISARSWRQFRENWGKLNLYDKNGEPSKMFLLPGNHDISNAVGHPAIPPGKVDATAAAEIYNAMLAPDTLLTKHTYNHDRHRCNYFFDASGVRFLFVDMWPDSTNRAWLEHAAGDGISCLLFVHDQPDIEAKHLAGDFNDGFENLLSDPSSVAVDDIPQAEHDQLRGFLATHPEIKAYFHGNENYNEFYLWGGLPIYRVDSPVKGVYSHNDESLLSFQLVAIDTQERLMSVREVFWNSTTALVWGQVSTISF